MEAPRFRAPGGRSHANRTSRLSVHRGRGRGDGANASLDWTLRNARRSCRGSKGSCSHGNGEFVLLAAALAQEPEVLLLDEPSNHLDLQHQLSLHKLLRDLSRQGLLVVAVTHDLNLAAAYAPRLILMKNGQIRADGSTAQILGSDLIEEIFQVRVEVHHRSSGQPWLVYGE